MTREAWATGAMYESGLHRSPHRLLSSRQDRGPVTDQNRVEIVFEQPREGCLGLLHVGELLRRQQVELAGRPADQRVAEDQVAFAHVEEQRRFTWRFHVLQVYDPEPTRQQLAVLIGLVD